MLLESENSIENAITLISTGILIVVILLSGVLSALCRIGTGMWLRNPAQRSDPPEHSDYRDWNSKAGHCMIMF
ncbi:hypothetical protein CKALI_11925 [Corynebacterium kalinowskii]|uniref:Uncharacterized protein n=1 Tax=Corynebacterium kalinowskii TaxID=2675216 RepID=A0A6B8VGE9_9CORY|nr:hypothetical protein CKALI_11925 [Corynebacterium kalinowskii]